MALMRCCGLVPCRKAKSLSWGRVCKADVDIYGCLLCGRLGAPGSTAGIRSWEKVAENQFCPCGNSDFSEFGFVLKRVEKST